MKIVSIRLKAFTIMEMTIAMLISAIVIGITYTAYQIMSKSFITFNNKNTDMAVVIRIDELLKKDFAQASDITFAEKTLTFKDSAQLIKYQFDPNLIIRFSSIADTFKVESSDPVITFEHQLLSTDENYNDKQPSLDELSFNVNLHQDTLNYHYFKKYSSQQLIKLTTNAGN